MTETGIRNNRRNVARAIDLQQLRLAVVACDCGSFRRAAEALSIKHNVLSRSISQLEYQVGASLFDRSSGGIKPTLAGRAVLRIARLILEQVDMLVDTGRSGGRGDTGHLVVGFYTSMSTGNLRATIAELKKLLPQLELATMERSRSRLATALRNGTVDIVISPGRLPSKDTRSLLLWSERILISLPQDHCLAAREIIYWTDLRNEKILLSEYDPGRELEDLLISKLVRPDDRPKVERHDVSRGIIKSLTSMGMGLSLVMQSDIGANFAGLVYRELQDGSGPSRVDFHAHWRDDNENPALKRFLDLLAERYPSPPPAVG
ncbi:LysR family transcriptional regulator [Bradyrhizobium elkanii]|uniref:DNA-binding transcriptional LysR family regulator n=1 Tax=Bradyrhizobium elkanii TaxID=29448 RepID=A0ABV4F5G5_BRAEL|nr:LysR family transcriptional regulator [Bradyrhizobium elkanii]MCP1750266.1 DNA-binding transcriptional LysR family regulator [Bradyrhizobium elkanii]MCP1976041.1 DNA-binding transcriptional LysR family regulator [Bradyrhizobium elkanii]MCS3693234.1 DNA-binding transcriptional LysR family regulator [Bradyrhizobium elkanii]MCS3889442.1 DNA-binding transcriptional LysR family regulator [Bradyrhizobium elkanii]MCS4211537.1 DNA-binding transcriptional LysR family regulator [Bradyrhizobium elkani